MGSKIIIGDFGASNLLTYASTALSMVGMALTAGRFFRFAMVCLVLAGLCDVFDGRIAKRCKRTDFQKAYGIQLDSLADTISFVAFPAVFAASISGWKVWFVAASCLYTIAGIARLAFFNVRASNNEPQGSFIGVPVTAVALVLPLLFMLASITGFYPICPMGLLLLGFSFIMNMRVPKPVSRTACITIVAIGIVLAFLLLAIPLA